MFASNTARIVIAIVILATFVLAALYAAARRDHEPPAPLPSHQSDPQHL